MPLFRSHRELAPLRSLLRSASEDCGENLSDRSRPGSLSCQDAPRKSQSQVQMPGFCIDTRTFLPAHRLLPVRGSRAVCCAGFVAGSFHRPAGVSDCWECLLESDKILPVALAGHQQILSTLPYRCVLAVCTAPRCGFLRLRPKEVEIESFKELMSELWYPNAEALLDWRSYGWSAEK